MKQGPERLGPALFFAAVFLLALAACGDTIYVYTWPTATPTATASPSPAPTGTPLPTDTFTPTEGVVLQMARVPAGSFLMGSPESEPERTEKEGPQHTATLTRDYWLMTTELTQGEWRAVTGENPSRAGDCGDDCPVEQVSWSDAVAFCNALSDLEGLGRCYSGEGNDIIWDADCTGYRLPTEAEWEYAARAETTTPFYTGACLSAAQADYDGNFPQEGCPAGVDRGGPIAVGSLAPNPWGLYDMACNVWEWVWDRYGAYTTAAETDPAGPDAGAYRVMRGGGWIHGAARCRSANRDSLPPGNRERDLGLRLARTVP